MPPYRKKLGVNKSQSKIQCTKTKVNPSEESHLGASDKNLGSENESCDGSEASNISDNSTGTGDVFSDAQNSEHVDMKEEDSVQGEFPSVNNITDSPSPKQSSEKNDFTNTILQLNGSSDSDTDSDAESRKQILRSAEKRIIRKVSTSESDGKNKRICDRNESSSESDSAPEDVTFETGRKIVLEVNKHRVESIQQATLKRKQQRKKILENYKKQKEEKLLRQKQQQKNMKHASSSISVESPQNDKPNSGTLENTNNTTLGKKIYFSSDSDTVEGKRKQRGLKNATKGHRNLKPLSADILGSLYDAMTQTKTKSVDSVQNYNTIKEKKGQPKVKTQELQWDTDYIPLDSNTVTQFGVVPLDKPRKKTVGDEAAAFRQSLLYGDKMKRAPAILISKRQQKLKACGMDRLVTRPV